MGEHFPPPRLLWRVDSANPVHVRVAVFCGYEPGSRGRCGDLVFRCEEWWELVPTMPGDIDWRGHREIVEKTAIRVGAARA